MPLSNTVKSLLGRLAAVCFGGFVAALLLIGAELVYRYLKIGSLRARPLAWVEDPDLFYRQNPDNPETPGSFRGKPPGSTPGTSALVICLGGSTTFGHNVDTADAWPAVVEEVLRTHQVSAEVINAGVPGYGSRQLLIRYRKEIADFDADYVVLYAGWNRTGALVDPHEFIPAGVIQDDDRLPGRLRSRFMRLARGSQLLRDATRPIRHALRPRAPDTPPVAGKWRADPFHDVFAKDYRDLVGEILSQGQRPVLVVYPALLDEAISGRERELYSELLWGTQGYFEERLEELRRKHGLIRAVALEFDVPLIDMAASFESYREEARMRLFLDEMHLSVEGNRLVGQIIGNRIADLFRDDHDAGPEVW